MNKDQLIDALLAIPGNPPVNLLQDSRVEDYFLFQRTHERRAVFEVKFSEENGSIDLIP